VIRILHIVGSASISGTTKHLAQLAAALPKSEFASYLVALDGPKNGSDVLPGVATETIVVGRHTAIDPLSLFRLRAHIRELRPDIVHTWQFEAGAYGRIAARMAGVRRFVAGERSIPVGRPDLAWAIERRIASRTDRIVVNSTAVRDYCIARGLPQSKVICIPNAVPPAEPARLSRPDFLAQLGLPADAKLILYLGPLVKEKRLKELIWAADQLKAVAVPAHLLVVGDGPLRTRLERFRKQNRINDRVHFLGQQSDVWEFLGHADVLWQAGAHEGQSSAILEAMAAGVPVVAADAAGNRELVTSGETGYLVPVNERAGFARWTLPLLEDVELARRMGGAGRQRAERHHRIEGMAARYAELYRG
jgi:glycosyltransferase involved in cell wall biosynthesis